MKRTEKDRARDLQQEIDERVRAVQAERQRAMRLRLLADVGRRTTAILSLEELLKSAVAIIRETFQYFMVNIFLVDGPDLVARACTMPALQSCINTLRLAIGKEGITGWVAAKGQPLNVPDVHKDSRYRWEREVELRTMSELAVPITMKGSVIGVLDIQSEKENAFSDLDVFTLETVAGQLAVAIENARLYEELKGELAARERTANLLRALNAAGLAMQKAASPWAVFSAAGEELQRNGMQCSIHLMDATGTSAAVAYPESGSEGAPAAVSLDAVEGFKQIAAGGPAMFFTAEKAGRLLGLCTPAAAEATEQRPANHATILAPLLYEDRLLGFYCVHSPELSRDDIPAMRVFANEIAIAWRKAQLVHDLEESLRELGRTQGQLLQSQKMEAVGRLAGGVAHDFNNQLTAIMGYAQILRESLEAEDPRRADLDEIRKAADRAGQLTRQLLAFSRKQVLSPCVLDLNALVEDMRALLARMIGEDVRLETRMCPQPVHVRADAAQIQHVIMNMVANSRDAMPSGGTLTISVEHVSGGNEAADLPDLPAGNVAVLRIADTGVGMDAETRSRLFEPFFTTKEVGRGTGLGLSTAYGFIKQSGGHIACRSRPGTGTTFLIYLPVVNEPLGESLRPFPRVPPAGGKETVLVVEDEEAVRDLVCRTLKHAGYTVISAKDGVEGLRLHRESEVPIQLVITDLVLPHGVSGLDVARRVLDDGRSRLICVSGYSNELVSEPGMPIPKGAFLQKPFDPDALLGKVREIIEGATGS